MLQEIIVYIIVAACFLYALRHFLSFFRKRKRGGKPGCGCGCPGCQTDCRE